LTENRFGSSRILTIFDVISALTSILNSSFLLLVFDDFLLDSLIYVRNVFVLPEML
jgi:hypothetical protein